MFSLFKQRKKPSDPQNLLFMFSMHIGRGSNPDMPANFAGAYVPVYLGATDYEAALTEAVAQIRKRGYEFIDLADGKAHQLDPLRWSSYVKEAWPEFESHFPTQDEVVKGLDSGQVFFGPFASYEQQSA
jgi:hypothetical protein